MRNSLITLFLVALAPASLGQESSLDDWEEVSSDTMEEIVVYGDKSLHYLRDQLYEAEDNFFEMYSKLNTEDEYDMRCFDEAPIYTRIKRRVCRARFVSDATSREYAESRLGIPSVPAESVVKMKTKRMNENMIEIVAANPELLEALIRYAEARQVLDDARKKRCEGRILICSK